FMAAPLLLGLPSVPARPSSDLMGVKRSYAPAELQNPFAVARLTWTGQTDDPELRREFARMHAERMLDGTAALYGASPASALPERDRQSTRLNSSYVKISYAVIC